MRTRLAPLTRGFTLLEALVTLVIVSLLVAVLMQAMAQTLGMRERVARVQRETRLDALQAAWFSDTVAGMLADLPEGLGVLDGAHDSVAFGTTAALSGGLARVQWELVEGPGGSALQYRDPATGTLDVLRGPLRDARFDYLDEGGEWVDRWPPRSRRDVNPDESVTNLTESNSPETQRVRQVRVLPRLVRLRARTDRSTVEWVAAVQVSPWVQPALRPAAGRDGL